MTVGMFAREHILAVCEWAEIILFNEANRKVSILLSAAAPI